MKVEGEKNPVTTCRVGLRWKAILRRALSQGAKLVAGPYRKGPYSWGCPSWELEILFDAEDRQSTERNLSGLLSAGVVSPYSTFSHHVSLCPTSAFHFVCFLGVSVCFGWFCVFVVFFLARWQLNVCIDPFQFPFACTLSFRLYLVHVNVV